MATSIYVRDLVNYPGTSKTVTVDLKIITPLGYGGDEQWVLSCSTTATASGSAAIQDMFMQEFIVGWCKSTGFNQGPYTVNASQNTLRVSIDGSAYRSITLANQDSAVAGEAVASDMQRKIRDLAAVGAAEAANLSFKNAIVDFESGRFIIKSGSSGTAYTGSDKSSVRVLTGASNDVAAHLGFYANVHSEGIAGTAISETYVDFPYTASSGLSYVDVYNSAVAATGDCVGITDGTNAEYRYVSSVAAGLINVNAAFTNNYAINSRVQVLRMQDPQSNPASTIDSVDAATRYIIAGIVNQINFAS